ncbi:MAG: YiiX/YebB-like N1pC/P60 family cysteine hydrolase [Bacteroidales bacterium]
MGQKAKKTRKFLYIALTAFFVITIVLVYFFFPRQKTITYYTDSDNITFHSGDIILRRGKSLVSQLVLLRDKASEYSHIGVIVIKDEQPYVIHAVPGEAEKHEPEYVKMETVKEFLDVKKSADFAVYTLKEDYRRYRQKVADKALTYVKNHVEFDSEFNLEDESKLYCTELIWRAYNYAGINLANSIDKINSPFYKGDFIYPSTLFSSPVFEKIYPK